MQVAGNPGLENQSHPLQVLQSGVAGVIVSNRGQSWNISIRGGAAPFVMIDDVPVSIESLNSLSVNDIERVEVWKGGDAAMFGARGGNGVIGFYTKKGGGSAADAAVVAFDDRGYQIEREFYVPSYDSEKPEHIKPDKRATLFWAPLIKTDSSGRASVSFYNHDVEGSVTTVAEGISVTGKPGAATYKYVIRKN